MTSSDDLRAKNLLHAENVHKRYGEKIVLDDVDLSVRAGEFVTVVGPSGCGKSTLLRLIVGQERPTSGDLFLDGQRIGLPDSNRGIVYQKYSLFPHLTVLENVLLSDKLQTGDTVISKGDIGKDGEGFPPGLVVGRIISVNKKASALFQSAEVESLVDVTRLKMVFVMSGF